MKVNHGMLARPYLALRLVRRTRNFRDAVMGSKKLDRTMELLHWQAQVLGKFVIPTSDLSQSEIISEIVFCGRTCPSVGAAFNQFTA
jgi:hypothetical protein